MKSSCFAWFLRAFWHHAKIQRNLMIQFQENTHTNVSRYIYGQTLFHRILPVTTGGLTSKTTVNWHLKVKDVEYNLGLTRSYCITVSMQKISSIHKLTQQIWGSHELNWPHPILTTSTQKSLKLILAFVNLHQHAKKLVHSINSFLRYSQF